MTAGFKRGPGRPKKKSGAIFEPDADFIAQAKKDFGRKGGKITKIKPPKTKTALMGYGSTTQMSHSLMDSVYL